MRRRPEEDRDSNKHWLGEVQPVGVVVTAAALAAQALVPAQQTRIDTEAVAALLGPDPGPALPDAWAFLSGILDWRAAQVAGSPGGPVLPDALRVALPASDTVLEPHLAVATPDGGGWQLLVRTEAQGIKPEARGALPGWEATPHQRFERLLRDAGVPTGLLLTDDTLRLVHAPKGGETSGWFEVPLRALGTVAGRTMLGGLKLLLDRYRLFGDAANRRLPALLDASRRSQAEVSTTLAKQVLGALHELLRGLHAAAPDRVALLTQQQPEMVYEGLLAVLMRLVFLLYAEDRGVIPSRDDALARTFYAQGYGVRSLHARLLEDEALHPDTMDERRGAWHRLLALFRLVHQGDGLGAGSTWMRGRGGKLFDPRAFPFLQGQATADSPIQVPPVSDGCVLRVLDGLLTLGGERLSYRALDVEQIGSVYETVMGFTAQAATGPSLAIKAGKRDRTPVFVDLEVLAAVPGKDRLRWLKENTERNKFPAKAEKAMAAAKGADTLAAAFLDVVDERGSPGGRVWPKGTPLLQPTDERRRTGSHYTPRDLTAPIVLHALAPAFERIGPLALPEAVLALKVCDPAMGSGAFLVEACRQLAARLVEAWRVHPSLRPTLPPDEDEELHARRLVAQRCLYGVDRNPMAADLARLSLWLATLARDHEFTFLDHALRTGDSLVGLTRTQIERLDWADAAQGTLFGGVVRGRLAVAAAARSEIRAAGDDVALHEQERRQVIVEAHLADLRSAGDALVAAHFGSTKDKARRTALERLHEAVAGTDQIWAALRDLATGLKGGTQPIHPFHWELEFPEVFTGDKPGFDAIVGNPPFAGKNTLLNGNRAGYLDWLQALHTGAHGNADLVAHFVRRAFALLRPGGCFGLIATNTVGQGDTRESGLRAVIEAGGSVLRAIRRLPWPGEAKVVVSVVHVGKWLPARSPVLDGRQVRRISAYLMDGDLDTTPARLVENKGKQFVGCEIGGKGFTFDDNAPQASEALSLSLMGEMIDRNPKNSERIFPCLGGEEVVSDPNQAHRRYVIDFTGITESAARELWPDLLLLIERHVTDKTGRRLSSARSDWWQLRRSAPDLRKALKGITYALGMNRGATPHLAFARLKTGPIFTKTLSIFPLDDLASFSVLQSRVHETWARFHSSSMKDDLRYTPSDCFDTFAWPNAKIHRQALRDCGTRYNDMRADILRSHNEGFTKFYNRFHDVDQSSPDISRMRDLHHALDQAVLRAYSWDDLAECAAPKFLSDDTEPEHRYQGRLFWPAPFRDEVLARLLKLNAERAADERARGLILLAAEAEELEDV